MAWMIVKVQMDLDRPILINRMASGNPGAVHPAIQPSPDWVRIATTIGPLVERQLSEPNSQM